MADLTKKIKDFMSKGNLLVSKSEEHQKMSDEILRAAKELLWCDVFKDTIKGYDWYREKSLSLGRWAIGYNYAYVLVRVLNELRPQSILECGLGQSSKIIEDYVVFEKNVRYDIVEQDQNWVNFFERDYGFTQRTCVHIRNIVETEFCPKGGIGSKTYVYENFDGIVEGKKYELISIDGPWGGDIYSRVDVLNHIPAILADDFVIMTDDFERVGEQNMVKLLKEKLDCNNIPYYEGRYDGMKDICILVSEKWRFFTTM